MMMAPSGRPSCEDQHSMSNPGKSLPAILGGRGKKRKSDEMDFYDSEDDSMSENHPPPNSSSKTRLKQSLARSSRTPLSTLQQSSIQNLAKPPQKSSSPPAKKLKLRQSWSIFREFIQTNSRSRSTTPLPKLDWADGQELWDLMCRKESGMYARACGPSALFSRHPALHWRMRAILLDWMVEVCEVYRLHRETFYLAVDFVDRYLSTTTNMPKNRLQLVGVTSLFIGSKLEEIYPPKASEFAYVTDGACSEDEIISMELVILKQLNWGLSPMTPNSWMKIFMQVSHWRVHDSANFVSSRYSGLAFARAMQLVDLATLDAGSLAFKNSILAAAALALTSSSGRVGACAASGHPWDGELASCANWLSAHAAALREDEASLQPCKPLHNIALEDQHNIQTHTFDLALLDRAQERCASGRESPEASTLPCFPVEMTPPETQGDRLLRPDSWMEKNKENSTVFFSPQTPTSCSK